MGHHIQAFIGSRLVLEQIQQQYGVSQVVDLKQGLALLPLLDELYDAIQNEQNAVEIAQGFESLSPKIAELVVQISKIDSVGYVETEYFGGDGDQGAILAQKGAIVFGPARGSNSINAVLQLLGITKADAHDEFDAVGLGRFRNNENWIKQPTYGRLQVVDRPNFFAHWWKRLFRQ